MERLRFSKTQKRFLLQLRVYGILAFFLVMIVGFFIGLLFFIRPKVSQTEKRSLAAFPEFTISSFLDGSYFTDVSLWYSDTYPGRDALISVDRSLKKVYGFAGSSQMVGGGLGDDIPDLPAVTSEGTVSASTQGTSADAAVQTVQGTNGQVVSAEGGAGLISADGSTGQTAGEGGVSQAGTVSQTGGVTEAGGQTTAGQTTGQTTAGQTTGQATSGQVTAGQDPAGQAAAVQPQTEAKVEAKVPEMHTLEASVQDQIQMGMYVRDGAAYNMYYFDQQAATTYINALNQVAQKLAGHANVYSILVPNNSGVLLSPEVADSIGGSDQKQAITYYYTLMNQVNTITSIETLRQHSSEYIYFRTDHHWTTLGAYYIYRNYCEAKGWTPHELSQFQTMEFYPFLGTFYTELGDAQMRANPDRVTAYIPNGTNDMRFWQPDGQVVDWNVIEDVSTWGEDCGYYCFVGGDNPLSIIENPAITDGSSCLVLKESYGNSFAPFLVDHYQTVYIVDFRYANVNVADYVLENNIQDLIVINNIQIIAADNVAQIIAGLL